MINRFSLLVTSNALILPLVLFCSVCFGGAAPVLTPAPQPQPISPPTFNQPATLNEAPGANSLKTTPGTRTTLPTTVAGSSTLIGGTAGAAIGMYVVSTLNANDYETLYKNYLEQHALQPQPFQPATDYIPYLANTLANDYGITCEGGITPINCETLEETIETLIPEPEELPLTTPGAEATIPETPHTTATNNDNDNDEGETGTGKDSEHEQPTPPQQPTPLAPRENRWDKHWQEWEKRQKEPGTLYSPTTGDPITQIYASTNGDGNDGEEKTDNNDTPQTQTQEETPTQTQTPDDTPPNTQPTDDTAATAKPKDYYTDLLELSTKDNKAATTAYLQGVHAEIEALRLAGDEDAAQTREKDLLAAIKTLPGDYTFHAIGADIAATGRGLPPELQTFFDSLEPTPAELLADAILAAHSEGRLASFIDEYDARAVEQLSPDEAEQAMNIFLQALEIAEDADPTVQSFLDKLYSSQGNWFVSEPDTVARPKSLGEERLGQVHSLVSLAGLVKRDALIARVKELAPDPDTLGELRDAVERHGDPAQMQPVLDAIDIVEVAYYYKEPFN